MIVWLQMLILAVVQGIGEFLPISSSGHIVVGQGLFKYFERPMTENLRVNIVLHLGTLLAILVFYWRRIWMLLGRDRRVIGLLIVGSVPAAIAGLILKKYIEGMPQDPLTLTAGLMFPLTGLMLLWTARRETGQMACRDLGYGSALLIGAFQAFAILPGISRSGATIVAGLAMRLRRDEAATFSFLLAIPAIGGAGLLEIIEMFKIGPGTTSLEVLAVGAIVSFAVGLLSLRWLLRWLEQGHLHYFAWWVIPLGVAVIVWQLSS